MSCHLIIVAHSSATFKRNICLQERIWRTEYHPIVGLCCTINGFKELNVLGRGTYEFIYKVMFSYDHWLAEKQENVTTIIHITLRFEMELEILCSIRYKLVRVLCINRRKIIGLWTYASWDASRRPPIVELTTRVKNRDASCKRSPIFPHWNLTPIAHCNVKSSNILLHSD